MARSEMRFLSMKSAFTAPRAVFITGRDYDLADGASRNKQKATLGSPAQVSSW